MKRNNNKEEKQETCYPPGSSPSSPPQSYANKDRRRDIKQQHVRVCVHVSTRVFGPGLEFQGSLFSRHQEGPGDAGTAGLLELDAGT